LPSTTQESTPLCARSDLLRDFKTTTRLCALERSLQEYGHRGCERLCSGHHCERGREQRRKVRAHDHWISRSALRVQVHAMAFRHTRRLKSARKHERRRNAPCVTSRGCRQEAARKYQHYTALMLLTLTVLAPPRCIDLGAMARRCGPDSNADEIALALNPCVKLAPGCCSTFKNRRREPLKSHPNCFHGGRYLAITGYCIPL
jgi:hypothetical protein